MVMAHGQAEQRWNSKISTKYKADRKKKKSKDDTNVEGDLKNKKNKLEGDSSSQKMLNKSSSVRTIMKVVIDYCTIY